LKRNYDTLEKNSESERKKLVDDYEGKLRTSGSTQER
jgi:hypothetical protein